jgi:hypothetical protein
MRGARGLSEVTMYEAVCDRCSDRAGLEDTEHAAEAAAVAAGWTHAGNLGGRSGHSWLCPACRKRTVTIGGSVYTTPEHMTDLAAKVGLHPVGCFGTAVMMFFGPDPRGRPELRVDLEEFLGAFGTPEIKLVDER